MNHAQSPPDAQPGAAQAAFQLNLRLPPVAGQPATLFYLLEDAEHPRAFNQLTLETASGTM